MTTEIQFPQGPFVDIATGMVTLEWQQWLQNPQFVTFAIGFALDVPSGGTGLSSYTTGDLITASASTTLAQLHDVATGNVLLSGGVGVIPAWGKVGLTTHITGTLAVANGGTGTTSSTGTGSVVLNNSPTLVAPILGAASASSIVFSTTAGIIGTTSNNSAAAGSVGEEIAATLVNGSANTLATGTPEDITTLSLTAGDWDVSALGYFKGNVATTMDYGTFAISLTSAAIPTTEGTFAEFVGFGLTPFLYSLVSLTIPPLRISLNAPATVYLVAQAGFAVNSCAAYGNIRARRER